MSETNDLLADRVGERIEAVAREVAKLREDAGDDVVHQFDALLHGHEAAIRALNEIAVMLAAEVDRLRHQSAPSS